MMVFHTITITERNEMVMYFLGYPHTQNMHIYEQANKMFSSHCHLEKSQLALQGAVVTLPDLQCPSPAPKVYEKSHVRSPFFRHYF